MQWKPSKNQFSWAITIIITAFGIMLCYDLIFNNNNIFSVFSNLISHMKAISAGAVIAYLLSPVQNFIERHLLIPLYKKKGIDATSSSGRKKMRKFSVVLTIAIFLLVVYGVVAVMGPKLTDSIQMIVNNFPGYVENVNRFVDSLAVNNKELHSTLVSAVDYVTDYVANLIENDILPRMTEIISQLTYIVYKVISSIFDVFVGIIISIYLLVGKETLASQLKKTIYAIFNEKIANEIVGECRQIHYIFIGFITGKILDSAIIFVLCYIITCIIGTPFPLLVSFIVGVTNVIPFFGPYIGTIVGAVLIFMIDPVAMLIFVVFVIILQQIDGNIIGPKILGDSTGLSSFWVVFAIMFFGALWGPTGWLFGVPVFAVLFHLANRFIRHFLRVKKLPVNTDEFENVAYVEKGNVKYLTDKDAIKYNSKRPTSAWLRFLKFKKSSEDQFKQLQESYQQKKQNKDEDDHSTKND